MDLAAVVDLVVVVVDVVEVRPKTFSNKQIVQSNYAGGGSQFGNRGGKFGGGNDRGRGGGGGRGFRGGNRGGGGRGGGFTSDNSAYFRLYSFIDEYQAFSEREFMTDSIYVGQLPAELKENDLKKLFPKAKNVKLVSAEGGRPG